MLVSMKVREIQEKDISKIAQAFCFPWTTLQASTEKWSLYFSEHQARKRTVCVLEKDGAIIGYASLLRHSAYENFRNAGIPEIHDVWIAEKWRKQGFGKLLIQHLEGLAIKEDYTQIGLGVGLYADYGNAQRLYTRLGYVPDGKGITYNYSHVIPGKNYPADDELLLWLIKPL